MFSLPVAPPSIGEVGRVKETTPTLATVLAALPPDHADVVRRYLVLPRWQARALRLAARDDAIRYAATLVAPGMCRAQAATTLALALDRYLTTGGWALQRHLAELPETASVRRQALHRVLQLNDGKSWGLSARTITNILKGERDAE